MRFDNRTLEHLRGQAFSNALQVRVAGGDDTPDRVSLLVELCRGQRVIDLGFADHPELIDAKVEAGVWLHAALAGAADRCLGIDISEAGVAHARALGYADVVRANIAGEEIPEIADSDWDLMVMGELLEHVNNPVDFLDAIRVRYGSRIPRIVITVPNAFSARNLFGAIRGREVVNSDHRYWFTPYTLAKVLSMAGFAPEWFAYCESFPYAATTGTARRLRRRLGAATTRHLPTLRPGLVMAATSGV